MPSNHLILCHPLLLLPSIFPSIRGFFPMNQLFASGGQRIGVSASASVLPMNIQFSRNPVLSWPRRLTAARVCDKAGCFYLPSCSVSQPGTCEALEICIWVQSKLKARWRRKGWYIGMKYYFLVFMGLFFGEVKTLSKRRGLKTKNFPVSGEAFISELMVVRAQKWSISSISLAFPSLDPQAHGEELQWWLRFIKVSLMKYWSQRIQLVLRNQVGYK